jgi:dTDP-glucose pyrophosphorylase
MTNVVLMAGKGQRFADAGYATPKPLLPVAGRPMILRAVESMPKADKWVFVIRDDYQGEKEILDTLHSIAKDVTILVAKDSPSQLNSALLARKFYEDSDEPLFIGACDFGMVYDENQYKKLLSGEIGTKPDVIAWSFTQQQNLVRNPQAWGWLKQDENMRVHSVSVKIPISDDPYHDFVITGSFTFRSGKYFVQIAEEMIRRDIKVKNEFYIDSMLGLAIENSDTVISFPVKYIGWGTPADYEENKEIFS